MKKIFYFIIILSVANTVFAQNKKLTLYYPDSTKVVNIAGLDSMVIFICGVSKVSYGGKDYNTVLIGDQCWLKENLDVGEMIQGASNQTNNSIIEKYCYGNNPANCSTYGGFYQWDEMMQYSTTPGTQGICPDGWHIPTLAEFETLKATVNNDGNALKAIGQGTGGGAGTNTSGFSALLTGLRSVYGDFNGLGFTTDFWSSTEYSITYYAINLRLNRSGSTINLLSSEKVNGHSVRCIKD
ncbi:MAG TPA: FISUMP domain-containing protein [Ignavibacteriaceae bacterium]|nr:FISUMP domain-containing protein [Ignavibacteriaceae bacterium]